MPFCSPCRLAAILFVLAGCVEADEEPGASTSHFPPEASLRAPVIARVGATVSFDANASTTSQNAPLVYVFDFGDGTHPVRSTDSTIQHVFAHEGLYSVRVQVFDAAGDESLAVQDVAIREDFSEPPDFCAKASDCLVGNECSAGVCYSTGGAVE